jgi:hypothetical protein
MDTGDLFLTVSRLGTGAAAAFFAILLWSKTRDAAWMLILMGTIVDYAEIVYAVLNRIGVAGRFVVGGTPLAIIILPNVRTGLFIAAFAIMVVRTFGRPR